LTKRLAGRGPLTTLKLTLLRLADNDVIDLARDLLLHRATQRYCISAIELL